MDKAWLQIFIVKKKPQVNRNRRDANHIIFRHFGNVIRPGFYL